MSQRNVRHASWEYCCEGAFSQRLNTQSCRKTKWPALWPRESRISEELFQTEFPLRVRMSRHEWFWIRSSHWGLLGQLENVDVYWELNGNVPIFTSYLWLLSHANVGHRPWKNTLKSSWRWWIRPRTQSQAILREKLCPGFLELL